MAMKRYERGQIFINRIKRIYPFIILITLFSMVLLAHAYGVCINVTPSMRKGLYIRDNGKIHRGDIVEFCLNEPYKTIGLKNFYIEKGTVCQGADPLIKQVIAIPGDGVRLTDKSIVVNSVAYSYPTFYADSNQRKLAVYPRGTYRSNGYWLIGTHSIHSWDSRYFGAVSTKQILYKLKPLVLW